MTGHTVLAEELQPGQRIHLEPHQVHGHTAGLLPGRGHEIADVEVDNVEPVGDCDISVLGHPCYLGGNPCEHRATTYHRTDPVLVIGQAPKAAA